MCEVILRYSQSISVCTIQIKKNSYSKSVSLRIENVEDSGGIVSFKTSVYLVFCSDINGA